MAAEAPLDPDALIEDVVAIVAAVGVRPDAARILADSLVRAEMWGHPSHGLLRVRWYVDRLRAGVMDPDADPEIVVDGGAFAVVDGHDGIGQAIAAWSLEEAVRRSRVHGVGVVSVRNSNHFGTAAYFTRPAARAGCVALLATNSSPAMAPWGGREKVVGANPWSLAAPAGRWGEAVMDISNTTVARGKIYAARERSERIPEGWAMDASGRPMTDPLAAIDGLVLPIGEHKGYAISFMMDVLAGVLSGSASGTGVSGPQQSERRSRCGHFAMALDIASFTDPGGFVERIEGLVDEAKSVPLAPGAEEILVPGEPEARNERTARTAGLRVAPRTLVDLGRLAREVGVELRLQPIRGPADRRGTAAVGEAEEGS